MNFPCNECSTPTPKSYDPDRWICAACRRKIKPPADEKPTFAVEPDLLRLEAIPVEKVIGALQAMANDQRITNEPVRDIFQRAVNLLVTNVQEGRETSYLFTLEEAQRKHVQSMLASGIDPSGEVGMMLRGSFLSAWKVARARAV